jgi:Dolichyl-phosphate-mannose-protein mannosyltransferase
MRIGGCFSGGRCTNVARLALVRRFFFRLGARLRPHWGLVFVTLLALAVRLVWDLEIHRPLDFAFSDMGGYLDRANEMIDRPWVPAPYLTLYPWGTHAFIWLVKLVFGRNNGAALGAAFAVVGALAVGYGYALAARFAPRPRVRHVVGFILVFYYPWISLCGYALSELPFLLCVSASTFHALRLADRGRAGDGWWLGIWLALGAAVRPQILVAAVFLAIHFVLRRRAWKGFRPGLAVRAALPLALVLAFSSARIHWHTLGEGGDPPTRAARAARSAVLDPKAGAARSFVASLAPSAWRMGEWGLVSKNGPLNAVFGRCHNTGLNASTKGSRGFFGPPAFGALLGYAKDHPHPFFTLDPAFGESLTIEGHMWDAEPNRKLAAQCVKKTGWWRQVKYMATHVVLLWGYNIIWPDLGQKLAFRLPMAVFCVAHASVILPPAALAMLAAFRRRRARTMLLALQVWSVVLTSMLYFGDTRYRAPYDGVLTVLAVATLPGVWRALRRAFERVRWALRRRPRRGIPSPS